MMLMNEQNRTSFLSEIARQLRREVRHVPAESSNPVNQYPQTRLTDKTQDQLCQEFLEFASTQKVTCVLSRPESLIADVIALCERYGSSPVVVSGDQRLKELGITPALKELFDAYEWDPSNGEDNIHMAEKAKVGLVYAEAGLTESGGVVLFSAPERGRSVSLLPETSVFVLRKSTILPRVAQMAQRLHQMAQAGERMPSCINLIGGPSSTADIELIKVFGVHGPVHAAYVVLEDC
ncbi:LutC/YkgG family protein [Pragia fontium]|uniref:LutC/YkgG family protein n=1 Tax=Pragia fontium TaxID=82985 RepID=UPI000DFF8527|nr:lactate utilization protein C [Pragia fontium]SUB83455.1 Lactate utilization protein C [Pragia fontium]VEJ56360.1 Lactate utilization protein C [Pragia fontium]